MPLPSIPGEQISTVYAFTIHPGEAGPALHGGLSHFSRPLLSISRQLIPILYPRLYHPSRGSRSHTVWKIKPITKIRLYAYYNRLYYQTKPQKPPPKKKKTRKSHNATLPIAYIPPLYIWLMFQANTNPYLLLAPRPNRSTLFSTAYKRYSTANNALSPQSKSPYLQLRQPVTKGWFY